MQRKFIKIYFFNFHSNLICQDILVVMFGISFMAFYVYITSLKLIPDIFPPVTFSIFIIVSVGYSCLLYNIIFEFSNLDIWNQNKIILISFLAAVSSYIYKDKIKSKITRELLKYTFEILSIVTIHFSLYDKNMSDLSIFLYSFSGAYIIWEAIFQYKSANNLGNR
jgi:hypothetical protein